MFKVGDKVRRIRNQNFVLWKSCVPDDLVHSVVTVSGVAGDGDFIYLVETSGSWNAENFELVTKKETKMISLKDHKTELVNLHVTISALDKLGEVILHFSEDKSRPAYVNFGYTNFDNVDVQIDREIMVAALKAQRQKLVDSFATLGIDAS